VRRIQAFPFFAGLTRPARSEWFMGVAALEGYAGANGRALDSWEAVYPNALLLALTDTFSTKAFFEVRAPAHTAPADAALTRRGNRTS
jgi:hypothetical protein